jgi:hypothetical protein
VISVTSGEPAAPPPRPQSLPVPAPAAGLAAAGGGIAPPRAGLHKPAARSPLAQQQPPDDTYSDDFDEDEEAEEDEDEDGKSGSSSSIELASPVFSDSS